MSTMISADPGMHEDGPSPAAVEPNAALGLPVPARTSSRIWEHRYVAAAIVVDATAAGIASLAAFTIRPGDEALATTAYLVLSVALPVAWVIAIGLAGGYQRRYLGIGPDEFNRVALGALGLTSAVGIYAVATSTSIARGYVVMALPLAAIMTSVGRYALRKHVHRERSRGRFQHSTIVMGHRSGLDAFIRHLERSTHHGYDVVGACVPDGETDRQPIRGVPVLGTFRDVTRLVGATESDTVAVVSTSDLDGDALRQMSWELAPRGTSVVVAPSVVDVVGPRMSMRPVEGLPLLHVDQPALSGVKRVVKQSYDPIVAAVVMAVLSPLFLALAVAIKVDSPGPIFFRQTRVGRMGEEFSIYKFRTMVVDAEARKGDLSHLNESSGPLFKMREDPRVTHVGAFLRRTSLDELPQLMNVLFGQMSLVGPRPHLPEEVALFGEDFRRRLLVRPGMTGLWQVSGRSDLSFEESVRVDLRYVENWSLGLDIFIAWKTVSVMVRGSGAY